MSQLGKLKRGKLEWPIVDFSTFSSVESLMRSGPTDPWATECLADLVDFYVYSDNVRFVLPHATEELDLAGRPPEIPALLGHLIAAEPSMHGFEPYSTHARRHLRSEFATSVLEAFEQSILPRTDSLNGWTRLYKEKWVRGNPSSRIAQHYVFDVHAVLGNHVFDRLRSRLDLTKDELLWALDVVLRYPLYGELAGSHAHYLSHPVRSGMRFPGETRRDVPSPSVPIRFGPEFNRIAHRMTGVELAASLALLRQVAREHGLTQARAGTVDSSVLREIAREMRFSPRVKASPQVLAVLGGVVSTLATVPELGAAASIVGGGISVLSALWDGHLPRHSGEWSWMKWAVVWDLEEQSDPSHHESS